MIFIENKKNFNKRNTKGNDYTMKIVVLNGSPKGKNSISLQYIEYFRKIFHKHEWKVFHVAKRIKRIENDDKELQNIISSIKEADGVLWIFGVFVLLVPSQYQRFIELINERNVEDAFQGKYTAVLSTSIHYFDHTAHRYMNAVCDDLDMKLVDSFSAYLAKYLNTKENRQTLRNFVLHFLDSIQNNEATTKQYQPILFPEFDYQYSIPKKRITTADKNILVITDQYDKRKNLGKMIDRFCSSYEKEITLVDLNDIDIKGGCLGCMKCGYNNQCQYKDGFTEFYNKQVRIADIIIFAGKMKGRFLSSKWKQFFDRGFFWTHRPSLKGKQIGYIISGPISQNTNLTEYLEATVTTRQEANYVGIVSDEVGNSKTLDEQIQRLADLCIKFSSRNYIKPQNFLGVGGHKIFRDEIWGNIRMIWQADHNYYRKNGKYDFPQKKYGIRIANFFMLYATKIPRFRKKFYGMLNEKPKNRLNKKINKFVEEDISELNLPST